MQPKVHLPISPGMAAVSSNVLRHCSAVCGEMTMYFAIAGALAFAMPSFAIDVIGATSAAAARASRANFNTRFMSVLHGVRERGESEPVGVTPLGRAANARHRWCASG